MRRLLWLVWLMLAVLVLAACGQSAPSPTPAGPEVRTITNPEITVYRSPT
jgi:ABC-type glycerol-3-phosphate transport system substrate-binding protein